MNKKDASVLKTLAELGIHNPPLTPEQEEILRKAQNPEEQFLDDVEKLFSPKPSK